MKLMSSVELLLAPAAVSSLTEPKPLQSEHPGLFARLLEEEVDRVLPAHEIVSAVDDLIASLSALLQEMPVEKEGNLEGGSLLGKLEEGLKQAQALRETLELPQARADAANKLGTILNTLHSFSLSSEERNKNQILDKLEAINKAIERKETRLLITDRLGLQPWQVKNLAISHPQESTQPISMVFSGENEKGHLHRADMSPIPMSPPMGSTAEAKEYRQIPIFLAKEIEPFMLRMFVVKTTPRVQEMILQLKPESLGKLDVKIQSINGQLTAKFIVETAMAKQAVEDQLVQLRHNLQLQGVSVQHLEVVESQNSTSLLFQQHQKQHPQEQRGYANRSKKNKEYMDPDDDAVTVLPVRLGIGQSGINYTV